MKKSIIAIALLSVVSVSAFAGTSGMNANEHGASRSHEMKGHGMASADILSPAAPVSTLTDAQAQAVLGYANNIQAAINAGKMTAAEVADRAEHYASLGTPVGDAAAGLLGKMAQAMDAGRVTTSQQQPQIALQNVGGYTTPMEHTHFGPTGSVVDAGPAPTQSKGQVLGQDQVDAKQAQQVVDSKPAQVGSVGSIGGQPSVSGNPSINNQSGQGTVTHSTGSAHHEGGHGNGNDMLNGNRPNFSMTGVLGVSPNFRTNGAAANQNTNESNDFGCFFNSVACK